MNHERTHKRVLSKSEEIKVTKSKDTGLVSVQTTVYVTDKRKESLHHNQSDAIREKDNKKWREHSKSVGLTATAVASSLWGLAMIINGAETINPEQAIMGVASLTLSRYLINSARNSSLEAGLAGKEINIIKRTK